MIIQHIGVLPPCFAAHELSLSQSAALLASFPASHTIILYAARAASSAAGGESLLLDAVCHSDKSVNHPAVV